MPVFAILLVCEGNQCRSPAAEAVLRTILGAPSGDSDRLRFEFMSAGLKATEGMPIHPLTGHAMRASGFEVPPHSSTRVSPDAVAAADLVLTADRAQRLMVAKLADAAAGRTFTLLEFAAVSVEAMSDEPAMLTPQEIVIAAAQGRTASWNDPRYDLMDPIVGDRALHAQVFDQVARASVTIARVLGGGGRLV